MKDLFSSSDDIELMFGKPKKVGSKITIKPHPTGVSVLDPAFIAKHPAKDWPPLTKEEILAKQQPSTQHIMKMTDEEHAKWMERGDPENWEANPDIKREDYKSDEEYWDAKVGARHLSPQDAAKYEADRRSRNHSAWFNENDKTTIIHKDNIGGEFHGSGVNDDKRSKAIDAYRFTKGIIPSEAELKKAIGLMEYKSEKPKEEIKKKPTLKKFDWIWKPYLWR